MSRKRFGTCIRNSLRIEPMNPGARCRQRVVWRSLELDTLSERPHHRVTEWAVPWAVVIVIGRGFWYFKTSALACPSISKVGVGLRGSGEL